MHDVDTVYNSSALLDVNRGLTIRATASWQSRVASGLAAIEWNDGVQTESLVHDVLQVLARLERRECQVLGVRIGAESFDDRLAQLVENLGVTGEHQEGPAKERSGGITTSQKNVQKLRA